MTKNIFIIHLANTDQPKQSMANSGKRKLNEIDDVSMPGCKRQKVFNDKRVIKTIFMDEDDKECMKLLETIDGTQMIESFQIPMVINKCIAEYTIGELQQCSNKKCDTDILILCNEWKYFDDNTNRWLSVNLDLDHLCQKCIHTIKLNIKQIVEDSDLNTLTHTMVTNKLRQHFEINFKSKWRTKWRAMVRSEVHRNVMLIRNRHS